MTALSRMLCLDDFEAPSRRRLPRPVFGYVAGATERNDSLADNARAFREWGFRPRVLVDVSRRTLETSLWGTAWRAPFGIAPMGLAALVAYRGDLALARAAREAGIPYMLSGSSLIPMEEVIAANPDAWFQAYLPGDPGRIEALIARAAEAGFGTLAVTVDTAVLPNRENNVRNGFSTPLRPSARLLWDGITHPRWSLGAFLRTWARHGLPHFENSFRERGAPILARNLLRDFTARDHLNWEHLALIRRIWRGRLVVKGVMRADDARRCAAAGADGVVVSNHGGRQLDGTAAPLRALPEVAEAVPGLVVMLDGGIRRGTDLLKAYALGAHFVFVGRPMLHAAAAYGEAGVARAIAILRAELMADLGLMGVASAREMTRDLLVPLPR